MKLVLNHTPLTPEARPYIPDKPGYPDYVALIIPLGTSSKQWCTPSLVYASKVKIKKTNNNFRITYEVGIYFPTHPLTQDPMATWMQCASKRNE